MGFVSIILRQQNVSKKAPSLRRDQQPSINDTVPPNSPFLLRYPFTCPRGPRTGCRPWYDRLRIDCYAHYQASFGGGVYDLNLAGKAGVLQPSEYSSSMGRMTKVLF